MVRVSNIRVNPDERLDLELIAKKLRLKQDEILKYNIYKCSIDARKKNDVHYVYTLNLKLKKGVSVENSKPVSEEKYTFQSGAKKDLPPLIVGGGPAGLMAALVLSEAGYKPVLIEQGEDADARKKKVLDFWEKGVLCEHTNVQFGEGGAGTFSDGKLNTGINNIRCRYVLEQFVRFGAPERILYQAKPHVGTDYLIEVVKNIRKRIIECGGEVRFLHKLIGIKSENSAVSGAVISSPDGEYQFKTNDIILAVGHSAYDTFKMLYDENVSMCKKAFSVGVRIEHPQSMINKIQYGDYAECMESADYKLSVHLNDGRGVYTFCMCPGGYVVNSASEKNTIVTNGMSYSGRSGENANSALLVSVLPEDIDGDNPLSGFEFQRKIEKKAFEIGGGGYFAPCQRVGDFLKGKPSLNSSEVKPTFKPGVKYTSIEDVFPDFVINSLKEALPLLDKKLNGFADKDAILTAPETRSSSPVRVLRDESLNSVSLKGLYPCGEGAGYAGGIMSAAVDGIKCAEAVCEELHI